MSLRISKGWTFVVYGLALHSWTAIAQDAPPPIGGEQAVLVAAEAEVTPKPVEFEIGKATDALFAQQRSAPALKPRSIDGEQALRSYARYLKSFEHPIPEAFETGTQSKK